MPKTQSLVKKFKSYVQKLKILLILLTLIQVGFLLLHFFDAKLSVTLNYKYKVNWLIFGLNIIVVGIFIWFNWKKMPIERKTKVNNTFLILFLGIIGMWLCLPNKQELNKLTDQMINAIHNNA